MTRIIEALFVWVLLAIGGLISTAGAQDANNPFDGSARIADDDTLSVWAMERFREACQQTFFDVLAAHFSPAEQEAIFAKGPEARADVIARLHALAEDDAQVSSFVTACVPADAGCGADVCPQRACTNDDPCNHGECIRGTICTDNRWCGIASWCDTTVNRLQGHCRCDCKLFGII